MVAGKFLDPHVEKLESDMAVAYFMLPVPTSHSAGSPDKMDKVDKDTKRAAAPNTKGGQPPKKFQGLRRDPTNERNGTQSRQR